MDNLLRRRPGRVSAAIVVAPLLVAVIAMLWRPWAPVLDLAMTEYRIRDVGGRFTPRIGLPGRIGEFPEQGSHPGPWSFYLLAPVYRLTGSSAWSMQFGSVVVNAAALVAAIAIGKRIAGTFGALALAAVAATMVRGFGLNVMTHPWNPYFPLAIWLLLLVAAWAVLAGDHRMAVVVAFCATIAAQTHIPYLVSCVAVSVLVLAALVRAWSIADGQERREVARSTATALGVTLVLWVPPLVDQFRQEPGNMTMISRHFTGEPTEPVVPVSTAVGVFLRHLDVFGASWSVLTRSDGFVARSGVPADVGLNLSVVGGLVVMIVWLLAASTAFRMHHRLLNALNVVLATALVAGLVSMSRIFGKVWFYLTLWAWVTMLLVMMSVVWTLVVTVQRRTAVDVHPLRYVAVGIAAFCSVLSIGAVTVQKVPEPVQSEGLRAVVEPTVDAIERGVGAAVGSDGTYLVFWQDARYIGAQGYGLLNELERRGLDVGAQETWRVPVTPHRVLPPGSYDAEVHLVSGLFIDEWRARDGYVEIVHVDTRTEGERERYDELRERVGERLDEIDRSEVADNVDRNLFDASLDPTLPDDIVADLSEMLLIGAPLSVFIAPPPA